MYFGNIKRSNQTIPKWIGAKAKLGDFSVMTFDSAMGVTYPAHGRGADINPPQVFRK